MRYLFLVWACIVSATIANADPFTVNNNKFEWAADRATEFETMVWHPTRPIGNKDIYAYFHGTVSNHYACGTATNCVGDKCFKKAPPWDMNALTGISGDDYWAPKCPYTPYYGISMAGIGPEGIGLYTHTGPNFARLAEAFFQPKSRNIGAVYIGFEAHSYGSVKPFVQGKMRVWTKQAVSSVTVPAGTQAQQKMSVMLFNRHNPKKRLAYVPFTFCKGINCNSKYATAEWDGPQNNFFIGGELKQGQNLEVAPGVIAWRATGTGSKSNPFPLSWFAYEVSWANFLSVLDYYVARTGSDHETLFGPNWDQPDTWEVRNPRFGQEVKNDNWQTEQASIGGRVKWINITSVP